MDDHTGVSDRRGTDERRTETEPWMARRGVLAAAGMLAGGSLFNTGSKRNTREGSFSQLSRQETRMKTISFIGNGARVEYEVSVSGELGKSDALGASINGGDVITEDGTTATGFVGGGTDSYAFTGEITGMSVSDPGAVTVVVSPGSGTGGGGDDPSDGTVAPGEVQAAIDDTAASGSGVVRLQSGERYSRDTPLVVRGGVRLDFDGAHLAVEADVDALHIHPGSEVVHPWIDYVGDSISADRGALVFDGRWGEYGWSDFDNASVWGGRISGVPHGGPRTTDGSAIRFAPKESGPISGVRVEGITASDFGQIWEIDSGDTKWNRCWSNSNLVSGNFGGVTQALYFHGANRMTDNRFTGFYQNGWMADRFCTLSGDARANWFVGTWWDLYRSNEVEAGGSAFHFGPDTRRNVSISRVEYRDWPDPLPINDQGHENQVLDQHAYRGMLAEYAL